MARQRNACAHFAGVYSRLKQFILDIYNGRKRATARPAYNADQFCRQWRQHGEQKRKITLQPKKKRDVTGQIYRFNNGK